MGAIGDLVMTANHGKQALILSGGGAHGAYEVGVLKALMTGTAPTTGGVPLDPAVLSGTSIGAYTSSLLVSQLELADPITVVEYLEHVWLDVIPRDDETGHNHMYRFRGDPKDYLNPAYFARHPVGATLQFAGDLRHVTGDSLRRSWRFARGPGGLLERALESVDLSTIITREPFERLLQRTIHFENIAQSRRVLLIAASNWRTGKTRLFTNRLAERDSVGMTAILASSAIPGFFPYVQIDGEPYVDGGLTLNTPLEPALHVERADTAHVIYVDPYLPNIPLATMPTTLDTMDRFISVVLANSMHNDIETARRINEGLRVVGRAARGEPITKQDAMPFILAASRIADAVEGVALPVSIKAIHRYRPTRDLGGALEMLDFGRERMGALIELGYHDAMEHDCQANGCVV
jgi:NTE family protein